MKEQTSTVKEDHRHNILSRILIIDFVWEIEEGKRTKKVVLAFLVR